MEIVAIEFSFLLILLKPNLSFSSLLQIETERSLFHQLVPAEHKFLPSENCSTLMQFCLVTKLPFINSSRHHRSLVTAQVMVAAINGELYLGLAFWPGSLAWITGLPYRSQNPQSSILNPLLLRIPQISSAWIFFFPYRKNPQILRPFLMTGVHTDTFFKYFVCTFCIFYFFPGTSL